MSEQVLNTRPVCVGIEIEPGEYSGCGGGGDCPTCEGGFQINNCPSCTVPIDFIISGQFGCTACGWSVDGSQTAGIQ